MWLQGPLNWRLQVLFLASADVFPVTTGSCDRKYLLFNKTTNTNINYDITTSQWEVVLGGGNSRSRENLIGQKSVQCNMIHQYFYQFS